jgi:hypothetical protein
MVTSRDAAARCAVWEAGVGVSGGHPCAAETLAHAGTTAGTQCHNT